METIEQGVFIIRDFKQGAISKSVAYLKPGLIKILSAPAPVFVRTVTYCMHVFDTMPIAVGDFKKAPKFVSAYNGYNVFCFNVPNDELSMDVLLLKIRQHFLGVVYGKKLSPSYDDALERIEQKNATVYALDDGITATQLVLINTIAHDVDGAFYEKESTLQYTRSNGRDAKRISVPGATYGRNLDWKGIVLRNS
jgi:hypothetical protein